MEGLATILMLPAIAAIGFAAKKTKLVSEEAFAHLPELMLRICYPLLILKSLTSIDIYSISGNSLVAVSITLAITLVMFILGKFIYKNVDAQRRPVYIFNLAIGNVVYITLPVVNVLFGAPGVVIAMLCTTAQDIFMWSVFLLEFKSGDKRFRFPLKTLLNPCFIALLVGLMLSLFRVTLPPELAFIGKIADMTSPLGMLFVGAILADCGVRSAFMRPALLTSLVKVIVVPLIGFCAFFFITHDVWLTTLMTVYFASPCAVITAVWSKEFSRDINLAAGSILTSTVLYFVFIAVYLAVR